MKIQTIAQLVKDKRIEKKLTQQQLGCLLGKQGKSAQIYVSHIENAKRKRYYPQELEKLAKVLEISSEQLQQAQEYTLSKNAISQKSAKGLRDILLRQTDILSLEELMMVEKESTRTWIVEVEGLGRQDASPLEFDLYTDLVYKSIYQNISNGCPYRYLLAMTPDNVNYFKKLRMTLDPAIKQGQKIQSQQELCAAAFLSSELINFAVMQLVIYVIKGQTVCYCINPIGADAKTDHTLCFKLKPKVTSHIELAFQVAWQKATLIVPNRGL